MSSNAEYHRNYYHTKVDKVRKNELKNERLKALKEFIWKYLLAHPCVDCGETDPIVLEFDHVRDNKVISISNAIRHGWSITRLQTEIDKCEVRCANCHRRKTARDFGYFTI